MSILNKLKTVALQLTSKQVFVFNNLQ